MGAQLLGEDDRCALAGVELLSEQVHGQRVLRRLNGDPIGAGQSGHTAIVLDLGAHGGGMMILPKRRRKRSNWPICASAMSGPVFEMTSVTRRTAIVDESHLFRPFAGR